MSPTQTKLEESYRRRRKAEDHADRLQEVQVEVNRSRDKLRREQANYKNAELVYKSLEAAIREVNVKFEDAAAFVQPAGQLIADRQRLESDIVSMRFALEESQRGRHEVE